MAKFSRDFAAMLPETSAARQRRYGGLPQGTYINEKPNGVTFPSSPFGLFILFLKRKRTLPNKSGVALKGSLYTREPLRGSSMTISSPSRPVSVKPKLS